MVSSVPPALRNPGEAAEKPEERIASVPAQDLPKADAEGDPTREKSGLREYFLNIYRAVTSIFEGLTVTKSWLFRRPFTVQYPDKSEKPVQEMLPSNYRGVLEVDLDLCSGCMLCTRACPIGTIQLKVGKNPETKAREISQFDIDIGQCMFCGLCTEACRFGALVHTTEFEASVPTPEQLVLRFVDTPVPVAKHKKGEEPERRRPGTILSEVIPLFGKRKPFFKSEPRPEKAEAKPDEKAEAKPDEKAEAKPDEKAEAKPGGESKKAAGEEPDK